MIRSLWFVHILLSFAMMGVGGIAGNILGSGPLDQSRMTELWLAGGTFAALTVAGLIVTAILSKSGFPGMITRPDARHPRSRG